MNCGLANPVDDFSAGLLSAMNDKQYNLNVCEERERVKDYKRNGYCFLNPCCHQVVLFMKYKDAPKSNLNFAEIRCNGPNF